MMIVISGRASELRCSSFYGHGRIKLFLSETSKLIKSGRFKFKL